MDFRFSEEEEQFKQDVSHFFMEEETLTQGTRREWDSGQGFGPCTWALLQKIGTKGWLCPTWPREYGGIESPFLHRYIIMEQMHFYTNIYSTVGAGMAGPIILKQGSDEQKGKHLLPIARGEIEFALGYSEAEAGSDLASLAIRAEDKGDRFVVNGAKLFNTRAHYAQFHWLGARTEDTTPKYKGISLFIVDMQTPGITVRPMWTVGGARTNEVFYDNVELPREALVGEKNRGFYYILEALDYERISTVAGLERDFRVMLDTVKENGRGKEPLVRQKLAHLAIEIESGRLLALRVASMLNSGKIPSYEAAMLKMVVAETEQRLAETAMQILGPYGQIQAGSKWAQADGLFESLYKSSLENLLTRGTSEIIRSVIAQRGLGLPRG
jgi:alkylation response protein AidB-like acyl-CoA dehydrogenase